LKRVYAFLDTAIAVASDEPSILDWLDEFLTPAFRIVPFGTPAHFRVTIRSDRRAAEEVAATRPPGLLATKPCFALDQEIVEHPHWMVSGRIAIDDSRFGAFYVLGENEVEVVIQPGARRPRSGAMRVIREIATARGLTDANHLLLHAAALERDGHGVLIAGAKGSGKTTVLAYLASRTGCGILTMRRRSTSSAYRRSSACAGGRSSSSPFPRCGRSSRRRVLRIGRSRSSTRKFAAAIVNPVSHSGCRLHSWREPSGSRSRRSLSCRRSFFPSGPRTIRHW
jgi:hypothetical protein